MANISDNGPPPAVFFDAKIIDLTEQKGKIMAEDQKQPVANTAENQDKSEQKPKTLGDILTGEGTNLVYVSGMLQGQQVNCEGPIEYTRKLDHPQWPFVPALPQYDPSKCKTPKFDWGKGEWVDESEEAKEKEFTDLKQAVKTLQANDQDTQGLAQKIDAIQQGQDQTTVVLGQLLPAVQELTKFAANLQNQESTQAQENTAKEEGNK